ncbi:MAG TPA: Cof-type HAD-IIB family hydrolase [Psychromonas sp.]
MIKLIATDMDGTLLNEQGLLPADFLTTFSRLKEKNIIFAAASGRQYFSLQKTFSAVAEDVLFIAENGTLVMYKEEELYFHPLEKEHVPELLSIAKNVNNAYTVLCGKRSAYIESTDQRFVDEVEKYYAKYEVVDSLLDVQDDVLKISICDFTDAEKNANVAFHPGYADKLQVTVSGKMWLDITHKTASKGTAIQYIQEKFDISFEQTMVFGDYFNDVTLLQNAFHSYAMENAHPEVKKHARFHAPSNDDEGVMQIIKQLL